MGQGTSRPNDESQPGDKKSSWHADIDSEKVFDQRRFATTSWSLVVNAARGDSDTSNIALAQLCDLYWYPLYAFVRSKGNSHNQAEDLTQGFFAHLLQNERLQTSDPNRGRFRNFLKSSMTNFMTQQWRHEAAQKRGGGKPVVSIDFSNAELRYSNEPSHELTPERLFDRRWALTLLEQAIHELSADYEMSQQQELFNELRCHLIQELSAPYLAIARRLSMSESAVKVAAFRMREKYRLKLRQLIAQTVCQGEDVDDEIRQLFAIFS